MKKLLPIFVWLSISNPEVKFDASGVALAVSACAVDSVAGRVCTDVTRDASARPVSVNGSGVLQNQSSVRTALRTALEASRAEILSVQTKENADRTRRQTANFSMSLGDL